MRIRDIALTTAVVLLSFQPVRAAELDKHVPDKTRGIVSVNLRSFLKSPLVQKQLMKHVDELLAHDAAKSFLEDIDLNPIKDIERIVLATPNIDSPVHEAGQEPAPSEDLAVVYGKFHGDKIRKKAGGLIKDSLVTAHKIDKHTVYETAVPDSIRLGGNKIVFVCLADDSTLLIAQTRAVIADALEKHDGKKKPSVAKEMLDLVEKVDGAQTIWFAGHGDKEIARMICAAPHLFRAQNDNKEIVVDMCGGLTVDKDVRLSLSFLVDTEDNAKKVATKAQVGINMLVGVSAFFSLNDDESDAPLGLSEALKRVIVKRDKRHVSLVTDFAGKELDQLWKLDKLTR